MKSLVELAILRRDSEREEKLKAYVEPDPKMPKQTRVRWVPRITYYRCGWYRGQLRKVTRFMRIEEKVCDPST